MKNTKKEEKKTGNREPKHILEWVENKTYSLKPKRDMEGRIYYTDALKYLLRVIEQNSPHFDLVLGLASFAVANHLSDKQAKKANEIINYYEEKGVL